MRIVFGQRNFKIKHLDPHEIGLTTERNLNYSIEIRQNYFHVYWIPFFGTGKIWGIRRDGNLYEIPPEFLYEIKRKQIKVRSPWYTYSWPILICFGFFAYYLNEQIKDYNYKQHDMQYFAESVVGFDQKIDKPGLNDVFILGNAAESSSESTMYLKVEKVYPDKITFSLIPGFFLESSQLQLEECYTDNKGNLESVTIPKSLLKKAFARDYEVSQAGNFTGQDLLKSGKLYALTSIEKKFLPNVEIARTFIDYEVIQIELTNTSNAFKIVSIKNVSNKIPWNIKLPLEVPAGTEANPTKFVLSNDKTEKFSFYGNQDYRFDIKILDSYNIEYTYQIYGTGSSNSIVKL